MKGSIFEWVYHHGTLQELNELIVNGANLDEIDHHVNENEPFI
jgi:hypothetical protein